MGFIEDCQPWNWLLVSEVEVKSDEHTDDAAYEEKCTYHSIDPLLSGEDRLKLKELMDLCTNLQNRVLDLEHTKTTQALEIESLKRRVKKLEKKQRFGEEDASKQRRINAIDIDEDIYLVNVPRDEDMFGVNDLEGDEVLMKASCVLRQKMMKLMLLKK
ncbi:hypothetical protein Tco_0888362 [Tanacetum coccineum]